MVAINGCGILLPVEKAEVTKKRRLGAVAKNKGRLINDTINRFDNLDNPESLPLFSRQYSNAQT